MILLRFLSARSFASFAFLAKIVPELSQNPIHCLRTPDSSSDLSQNARRLVGRAIELLQRLALHLQLHLRVLLEDLGVALTKELCHPLLERELLTLADDLQDVFVTRLDPFAQFLLRLRPIGAAGRFLAANARAIPTRVVVEGSASDRYTS